MIRKRPEQKGALTNYTKETAPAVATPSLNSLEGIPSLVHELSTA
jgi:hypothetical protein